MNMLSDGQTPRERLLNTLLAASCALEEATTVFGPHATGIQHLEPQVRTLHVSADRLIERLAD
jgi:hypothetical protein